jgi:hypothetical protein
MRVIRLIPNNRYTVNGNCIVLADIPFKTLFTASFTITGEYQPVRDMIRPGTPIILLFGNTKVSLTLVDGDWIKAHLAIGRP